MNRSLDEVKASLFQLFEPFPQVEGAQNKLRQLAQSPLIDAEPEIVMITGESGVGKTTILMKTAAEFPRKDHGTLTEIPVLYVRVTSNCTFSNLIMSILRAFKPGLISGGSVDERKEQVKTLIRNCLVRLVILDDANQMVDRGRSKSHYSLGDLVREICDETRVRMALSGVPRLWRMINLNEQLRGRVSRQIELQPLVAAGDGDSITRALKAFDRCLDGVKRIDLTNELIVKQMAFATAGRLRPMRNLFASAAEITFASKSKALTCAVLEQAFRETLFVHASPERNPFSGSFNGRPLTGPGEPFNADAGDLFND